MGSTSTDSTNQSENVGEKNPESLKEQNLNLSCTDKIYIAFLLYKYYRQSRAKFKLQLKKAGKTTRPFRYDVNQIPYDYTVEVTHGLDLIDRVPVEIWTEARDIVQEVVTKTIPKGKKMQQGKMVV